MKVYQKIATLIHDQTNVEDTEKVIAQCLHKTGLQSKFSIGPNTDPAGRYFSLWLDFANWDVEVCVFPDLRFGFEIQHTIRRTPDLDDDAIQNLLDHVCRRLQKVLDTDCSWATAA